VSEENVEIGCKGAEAFAQGDWERFGALRDPDVFVRLDPAGPSSTSTGARRWSTSLVAPGRCWDPAFGSRRSWISATGF
jgi:hypothetical protein